MTKQEIALVEGLFLGLTLMFGGPAFVYLFGSFVAWGFNPASWDPVGRAVVGLLSLASILFGGVQIFDTLSRYWRTK